MVDLGEQISHLAREWGGSGERSRDIEAKDRKLKLHLQSRVSEVIELEKRENSLKAQIKEMEKQGGNHTWMTFDCYII